MKKAKAITGGIYLVVNPAMDTSLLLKKVEEALEGGVSILQIWNNWPTTYGLSEKQALISSLSSLAAVWNVPLLINEEWELLSTTELDGVHFDAIPENYEQIKALLQRDFICGITCSNNLEVVHWAEQNQLDYISFCAMFPSSSVDSCELVKPETVQQAQQITRLPLFLSGGITPENLPALKELNFHGLAVISGVMNAASPKTATAAYQEALQKL